MSHPHGAPMTFDPLAALTAGASLVGLTWEHQIRPIVAQVVPAAADANVTWQFVALSGIGLCGMVVKGVFGYLDRRMKADELRIENEVYRRHFGPPPPKPGA